MNCFCFLELKISYLVSLTKYYINVEVKKNLPEQEKNMFLVHVL